jgi:hypothetical protein
MKKHVIIIGIVLVGAMVVVVPEIMRRYSGSTDVGIEGPRTPETLNQRIEDLGKKAFNSAQYQALVGEIIGYSSQRKITFAQKNLHLSTLNIRMQEAAAITFNESLSSCYSKSLGSVQRIADTVDYPIRALRSAKQTYQQFQNARGYEYQLQHFLRSEYSESKDNQLQTGFQNCISGQAFNQCAEIRALQQKLKNECKDFKEFANNFNEIVNVKKQFYHYDENSGQLTRYDHYRKLLIQLKNN